MTASKHWAPAMVEFLNALGRASGCFEIDEATPGTRVTIGILPDRYWVVIDDDDGCSDPVIATTDGKDEEGTRMIWFHDDGQPFRDALLESLGRWKRREDQEKGAKQ